MSRTCSETDPMPGIATAGESVADTYLILGDTAVAKRTLSALRRQRRRVTHLPAPSDDELRAALEVRRRGVAVLTHNDVTSLRYALVVAHVGSDTPLVVTIFDRTIGDELKTLLPQCHVTSPADLAAPPLTGPCLRRRLLAASRSADGLVRTIESRNGQPVALIAERQRVPRWHILLTHLTGLLRTPDKGTRLLLTGLAGLLTLLVVDWAVLVGCGHRGIVQGFHEAVSVIATVGPASEIHDIPAYSVFAALAMLAAIAFTAMFTAGIVDRILGPRLHGLLGPRVVPHSGHVIVIGLGQVGLRLCRELLSLGIPVVGVERDRNAANLRLVRPLRLPVVIGHGTDRRLLEKVGIHRARAVAAVGSDDLDNIAVAIAVARVAPSRRVVIRAGEHEAIAETRSLFPLGIVRDVASLSAAYVVARLLDYRPLSVISDDTEFFIEVSPGTFHRVGASPAPESMDAPHRSDTQTAQTV
ncbi:NAD-binding protein [Mycolicibacterium sp. HK-90]|uniref:NAD-binding protein n=1 Tax=Mycobacteriaceae TaxID=1762 RepID=UPI00265B5F0F|nr:NAD-binding protein [Mycolicibacterium sp. HK-90]WKG04010.1 NAD-binding protein [Mycolicibacterium sp. HK-90]